MSASRSVVFKSGEGKYCRGSKERVENDRSGLSALEGCRESCSEDRSAAVTQTSHKEESAVLD